MPETSVEEFGTTDDEQVVHRYVLDNGHIVLALLTYGATVQTLSAVGRHGAVEDVVLGFDDLDGYTSQDAYIGAVVGRYANRIARGRFTLDRTDYQVSTNDRGHALHGGPAGFHTQVWSAQVASTDEGPRVEFRHVSPDGTMGFPGTVEVSVSFTLAGNEVLIDYWATTDRPTVLNVTQHAYFNLSGQAASTIGHHLLEIPGSSYLPVDQDSIPLNGAAPVEGTPFDFRSPRVVGKGLGMDDQQLRLTHGYDHTWVLDRQSPGLTRAARLSDPTSGRALEVLTDQPGVQFYSGNLLDGSLRGKGGVVYDKHAGLCLETQGFPDSPNQPDFPSTVLRPGERFTSRTVWSLSTISGAEALRTD